MLPVLRVRTHDRFLEEMRYDERYTPLLQRAGLDVLSYQVRRGLPTFNPAALTALVDSKDFSSCLIFTIIKSTLHTNDFVFVCLPIGGGQRLTLSTFPAVR